MTFIKVLEEKLRLLTILIHVVMILYWPNSCVKILIIGNKNVVETVVVVSFFHNVAKVAVYFR